MHVPGSIFAVRYATGFFSFSSRKTFFGKEFDTLFRTYTFDTIT